jgi:FtsP/CotA-like multicopper oxidase with cupredoxin domain
MKEEELKGNELSRTEVTLTRRKFLQEGAGFGAGIIFYAMPVLGLMKQRERSRANRRNVRLARAPTSTWFEPEVISSNAAGELETDLRINRFDRELGSVPVALRLYESRAQSETGEIKPGITGPTLRFKKGAGPKKLTVYLQNGLPDSPDEVPNGVPTCHGPHLTNLHTHGLHVSPEEGDNVFLEIGQGGKDGNARDLIYTIPDGHYPGTFWYHPHKHGSVAFQVGNGLAGALIIEGDIDEVPEIRAAKERLFVFQQIPFNKEMPHRTVECQDILIWEPLRNPEPHITTINGQVKPVITMQPGEVQRWRFIHAGVKEKLRIGLHEHKLYVIAYDGITSGYMAEKASVELFPGERADVLVQASDTPATYYLEDSPESAESGLRRAEPTQRLAHVVVQGDKRPMNLPNPSDLAGLCPMRDLSLDPIHQPIALRFDVRQSIPRVCWPAPIAGCSGGMNCHPFEDHPEPIPLTLNTVDEWTVVSCNDSPHTFHIHVNPFQIMSIWDPEKKKDVAPQPGEKIYGDTLVVNRDRPVILRMNYTLYTGMSVLHCHILDHEDQGMMIKIDLRE